MLEAKLKPHIRTSTLLENLLIDLPQTERADIGQIVSVLRGKVFAILILIFALPVSIPNIPGISTLFAPLIIVPAIFMALNDKKLRLPKFISSISFQTKHLKFAIEKSLPFVKQLEKFISPRLSFLSSGFAIYFLALEIIFLSLILILPIPLGNMMPAIAIAIIALGILENDGLLIIVANILIYFSIKLIHIGIQFAMDFFISLGHWLSNINL